MSPRVFIHVQHLLGTGHVKRAAGLARAFGEAGCDVLLASGGMPLAGLDLGAARLVQLPPLRTGDVTFKTLVDDRGQIVDDAWKTARRERLLAAFAGHRPEVLITELFPFGRRMLEFELLPLLDAARALRPRPLILSSVRDVLIPPRDPAKAARAIERARRLYDRVLVHGDPELLDLSASYPAAREIADRLVYTGYVGAGPAPEAPAGDGADEVIVSAGGGAVGARLLEAAAAAQGLLDEPRRWRLLLGGDVPADCRERLSRRTSPRLIVEPARRDFPGLLARCHVSVSQAGYNTVMDILDARARAVLVPFAAAGETEQTTRARAVAARGWAEMIDEHALDAGALADAIDRAARRGRPDTSALRRGGGAASVRVVQDMHGARGGHA